MRHVLLHALSERARLSKERPEIVLAGLNGGAAALVTKPVASRLVTVLDPAAAIRSRWSLQGWLERRQARRSALIVAPDRPAAVVAALRLRLNLSRIRIERDTGSGEAQARLKRELSYVSMSRRAWHSAAH